MKTLKITDKVREELKKPLGTLLKGSSQENIPILKSMINGNDPPKIITVGDVVTENLLKSGIKPDLYIIDRKTKRGEYKSKIISNGNIRIKNREGTINKKVWDLIESILEGEDKKGIIIDGEEDLLGIPCVMIAPENSYVIYGQPNEGMVIIKVNKESRNKIKRIIQEMEE